MIFPSVTDKLASWPPCANKQIQNGIGKRVGLGTVEGLPRTDVASCAAALGVGA